MAELELWFVREPNAVLDKTTLKFDSNVIQTNRRTDAEPVQWRSGVQAHMAVFIRWAISARIAPQGPGGAPDIPAEPGTPACSVYHSLTKPLKWRGRLFGELPITRLIRTKQQNRKPFLGLDEGLLRASDIKVFVDEDPVEDAKELGRLADEIKRLWRTSQRPRRGPRPHAGQERPAPPNSFGELTEADRQQLLSLAAASLKLPPDQLSPQVGLVIGQARRVQLALEFRTRVGRTIDFLDDLVWEIERAPKEPDNLAQTRRNVTEFLRGFTESTRVAYDQASHWPAFLEVTAAVTSAVQVFGRAVRGALDTDLKAQIPAALARAQVEAQTTRNALAAEDDKLNGLYLEAVEELKSVMQLLESKIS